MINGLEGFNYNTMNGLFEINVDNINTASITTDNNDINLLSDPNSLNMYGKLYNNKRSIHLYDNVIIEGNINVKGSAYVTLSSFIYSQMPVFSVQQQLLNYNQSPTVSINNNNLANPIITFYNPVQSSFLTRCFTISGPAYVNQYQGFGTPNITILDFYVTCPYFKVKETNIISSTSPATVTIDNSNIYYPALTFNIPQGPQGIQGNTPIFNISNIYTISSYLNASVFIDNSNILYPSLTFNLPRGNTPIFDIGYVNTISSYLSPSVFIDNTIIDYPKLNFNFPRGEKGKDAVAPQFSIKSVGTVSELSAANVILYYNENNNIYSFDFQIPRGLPGLGTTGAQGPKGDDGKDGSNGSNGDATGATIAAGVAGGLAAGAVAAALGAAVAATGAAASAASASSSAAICTTLFTEMSSKTKYISTDTLIPQNPIIDGIIRHNTFLDSSLIIKSGANTVLTYLSNSQNEATEFYENVNFSKQVNFNNSIYINDTIHCKNGINTNFIKHLPYNLNGNKNQDINIGIEPTYGQAGIPTNADEATNNINILSGITLIIGTNKVTINSTMVVIEAINIKINGACTFNGPCTFNHDSRFLGPTFIIPDPL